MSCGHAALYAELARAFGTMVRVLGALPRQDAIAALPAWTDACPVSARGH